MLIGKRQLLLAIGVWIAAATYAFDQQSSDKLRVAPNVSAGVLNMRIGPGQNHEIVVAVPAETDVLLTGQCVDPDDGTSRYKWCPIKWNQWSGWASSGGLQIVKSKVGSSASSQGVDSGDQGAEALAQQVGALYAAGKYAEAVPIAERALKMDESTYGVEHPYVSSDLNNLANLYLAMRRYIEAEPLLKRSLKIGEKVDPNNPQIGYALNSLSVLYKAQGRFADAEPLVRRALAVTEKVPGPISRNVGTLLDNLGGILLAEGKVAEAESTIREALAVDQKILSADDPDLSIVMSNLGDLYRQQGRFAQAEPLYLGAIKITEKTLGRNHPNMRVERVNLAALYSAEGRFPESEELLNSELQLTASDNDTNESRILNELGLLMWKQGRYAEAERFFTRALTITEAASDREMAAGIRNNLGLLYLSWDRLGAAEPMLLSALNEADNPELLINLGDLYRRLNQCSKAETYYARASAKGWQTLSEQPIFFATNRARDTKQAGTVFTSSAASILTFGRTSVIVPDDEARAKLKAINRIVAGLGPASLPVSTAQRVSLLCIDAVNEAELFSAARARLQKATHFPDQALIYVHGFNNGFDDAERRAGQIAYDLHFDGAVFAFIWPSQNKLLSYWDDAESAKKAASTLKDFLTAIIKETGVKKIHIIAHSMGNIILLDAIKRLLADDPALGPVLGQIIAASPDVDAKEFAKQVTEINNAISDHESHFTMYVSSNDTALITSAIVHSFSVRAGYAGTTPLIVPGVDTLDVSNTGQYFNINHDLYATNSVLVNDMRRLIESGNRPPSKRNSDFEPVTTPDGTFWRLKPSVASP